MDSTKCLESISGTPGINDRLSSNSTRFLADVTHPPYAPVFSKGNDPYCGAPVVCPWTIDVSTIGALLL